MLCQIENTTLRVGSCHETEWGVGTNWYHPGCFHFKGLSGAASIKGFSSLQPDDKAILEGYVKNPPKGSATPAPKPKPKPVVAASPVKAPSSLPPLGPPTKGTHNARIVAMLREASVGHSKVHEKRAWEKGATALELIDFEIPDGKTVSLPGTKKVSVGLRQFPRLIFPQLASCSLIFRLCLLCFALFFFVFLCFAFSALICVGFVGARGSEKESAR